MSISRKVKIRAWNRLHLWGRVRIGRKWYFLDDYVKAIVTRHISLKDNDNTSTSKDIVLEECDGRMGGKTGRLENVSLDSLAKVFLRR